MMNIVKFNQFDHLVEAKSSNTKVEYTKELYYLLLSVLIYDLSEWFEKYTYFACCPEAWEIHDSIAKVIPSIKSKLNGEEVNLTELVVDLNNINSYIIVPIEGEEGLDINMSAVKYKLLTEEKSIITMSFEHLSNPGRHDVINVSFDDLIRNWKKISPDHYTKGGYHFRTTFLTKVGNQIKEAAVKYYVKKLYSIDKWQEISTTIARPTTSLFDLFFVAHSLLDDMITEIKKQKKKLPSLFSIYVLLHGHKTENEINITLDMFPQEVFKVLEGQPKLLTHCRKNFPELYKMIMSKRDPEDRWKTDLSADMGDLGFD